MKYCAVYGCTSSGGNGISMFSFPRDKILKKTWTVRTKRKDFTPSKNAAICSKHFTASDIIQQASKKVLRKGAVPSIFSWAPTPKRRILLRKHDESATDSASECGEEGLPTLQEKAVQTDPQPNFGVAYLRDHSNEHLIQFYTGFRDLETFDLVLRTILPDKQRENMLHFHNRKKTETLKGEYIFDSDGQEACEMASHDGLSRGRSAKLSIEDEFLMVLMKLRVGLFYTDLADRFKISKGSVQRIFYSWIQLMYLRLGSMKWFPHRNTLTAIMRKEFRKDHAGTMLIVDCTEVKIEAPSSLQLQTKTFSNYKSTNTLKCLIGVDSRGGIMFVSHLFTGSVSDKELCQRSGLFKLLQDKVANGELLPLDSIMADKGFLIKEELDTIDLTLNQPPFLKGRGQLEDYEVISIQTISKHRIHVERAIRKVRQFHIFDRKIPACMLHMINEIWLVCCLLSNFQPPIV